MADAPTNTTEYTVSEISFSVKRTIEDSFGFVRVRGEISGYRGPASSGHCYFSLKDEKAKLDAVVWRGVFGRLRFKPEEGLEVIASGKLTSYPGRSSYQIIVEALEPAGAGALMALLEERRKKLAAEGLFDADRKKPLPYIPKVIGVVTSPTGAVIRDIMHRLSDRFPTRVVIWPVRVQGETSAEEVAKAIAGFNSPSDHFPRPDLLIVARGGGSLEDLWSFNEEAVVRAVAASDIPVISAVGHETDWTLIDHVADLRAPTPTGAAEMAVPVRSELIATVADLARRLAGAQARHIETRRVALRSASRALPRPRELMALARQRFDEISDRLLNRLRAYTLGHRGRFERQSARLTPFSLRQALSGHRRTLDDLSRRAGRGVGDGLDRRRMRLENSGKLLKTLSYQGVLERGFALVRTAADTPVRSAGQVSQGDSLIVEFHDSKLPVVAMPESSAPRRRKRPAARSDDKDEQGSLF